jgi:hypothetical protein
MHMTVTQIRDATGMRCDVTQIWTYTVSLTKNRRVTGPMGNQWTYVMSHLRMHELLEDMGGLHFSFEAVRVAM